MDPLPIDAHLPEICARLRERGALVLVAEPGAGKTTRVPPALVDAGLAGGGRVIVLQPRRVAVRAAARRIAAERGGEVGGFCGFQIRFERCVGRSTRIVIVTEGILTRMLQDDPGLEGVAAVVLDEFHERSLHADLALALLAQVRLELRPELKLVVMSATIEAEPVARFLDAPIVRVPGRQFALSIEYTDPPRQSSPVERALGGARRALGPAPSAARGSQRTAATSTIGAPYGDVLVFLPGAGEIARVADELAPLAREHACDILALHGELRLEDQERALLPGRRRKVILATNIAETSLTVPGVNVVVDTGLARVLAHDPDSGLDRLVLERISLASAAQRAGRAARLEPGVVYRTWSKAEETLMRPQALPEIRRVDLAGCALDLHAFGERDLAAFAWFEAPEPAALAGAERLLELLGALEPGTRALTRFGQAMARLPVHPRLARMLVEAHAADVLEEGALLAALVSERDLVRRRELAGARGGWGLAVGPSDLLARRDLFLAEEGGRAGGLVDRNAQRRVAQAAEQLARACASAFACADAIGPGRSREDAKRAGRSREDAKRAGRSREDARADDETLLRVIWSGYPDRVARRVAAGKPEGLMAGGRGVVLSPDSVVTGEELYVVLDADQGGSPASPARARVRMASAVRRAWLEESPAGVRVERAAVFDEERERVVGLVRELYLDLPLADSRTGAVEPGLAARMLHAEARGRPEAVLRLGPGPQQLLARLRSLAQWMPELELPPHEQADLLQALEPWCQGCASFDELRALPWSDILFGRLSREQRLALEKHAPEALELPSGSTRRLEYDPGKPPVLAVRLQELFGLAETPRVAAGRIAVLLHLLAPNQRVVQVTQDLKSFWNTTYPQVRKDLRARYPRHSWPEDPWTAQPTARAKRRLRE